jgi:hypothetical protein
MLLLEGTEYLVEKEVQARYGLSIHRLRKLRYAHEGPSYHKLNKKIYYTVEQIDRWLKEHLKPRNNN